MRKPGELALLLAPFIDNELMSYPMVGWIDDYFYWKLSTHPTWIACADKSDEHKDRIWNFLLTEILISYPHAGTA